MMGPLHAVSIQNLHARYGHSLVLHDINLPNIPQNAVTVFAGPNGAGKSTLLRAMAGFAHASGKVMWQGRDLLALGTLERNAILSYMPQNIAATHGLTVLESVLASYRFFAPQRSAKACEDHVLTTLEKVGILDVAMKPLDKLSGGQRQLVSLAQSLVRNPEILLLDEPTSALDLRHQIEVMTILQSIAASGCVVIVVLHDLTLAANWSDFLVFLHEGRVMKTGPACSVLTPDLLRKVYGVHADIAQTPQGTTHLVVQGLSSG